MNHFFFRHSLSCSKVLVNKNICMLMSIFRVRSVNSKSFISIYCTVLCYAYIKIDRHRSFVPKNKAAAGTPPSMAGNIPE